MWHCSWESSNERAITNLSQSLEMWHSSIHLHVSLGQGGHVPGSGEKQRVLSGGGWSNLSPGERWPRPPLVQCAWQVHFPAYGFARLPLDADCQGILPPLGSYQLIYCNRRLWFFFIHEELSLLVHVGDVALFHHQLLHHCLGSHWLKRKA